MNRSRLPVGSKVSEETVLRGFMRNIHHAAHLGTNAARPHFRAYLDAKRRLAELKALRG